VEVIVLAEVLSRVRYYWLYLILRGCFSCILGFGAAAPRPPLGHPDRAGNRNGLLRCNPG